MTNLFVCSPRVLFTLLLKQLYIRLLANIWASSADANRLWLNCVTDRLHFIHTTHMHAIILHSCWLLIPLDHIFKFELRLFTFKNWPPKIFHDLCLWVEHSHPNSADGNLCVEFEIEFGPKVLWIEFSKLDEKKNGKSKAMTKGGIAIHSVQN